MTLKRNTSFRKLAYITGLPFALASCVSFGAKAPPTLLVLTASNGVQNGAAQSGSPADALIVLLPEVSRKIDTNRLPVQIDSSNIAYLKNALWADKPARMMQVLLMETISAKTGRLVLNEVDAGGKAQQFLSGSLLEFGIDSSAMEAVVVYDAVRMVRGQVVQKKRFEAREAVTAIEPGPSGAALNRAANRIAEDMAAWVS